MLEILNIGMLTMMIDGGSKSGDGLRRTFLALATISLHFRRFVLGILTNLPGSSDTVYGVRFVSLLQSKLSCLVVK